jgi:hypothetical protein
MKIYNKVRWIAGILLIFFIVLITNIIDRDNYNRLSNSVTTMYEDRIVASDLLFEMSRIIHSKKIDIVTSDTTASKKIANKHYENLDRLIDQYRTTKLTEKEKFNFNLLQEKLNSFKQREMSAASFNRTVALGEIEEIEQILYELSKIQLQEGKRQVSISNRAKDTIDLFTQGEIIFLIIMAILIQVIILYKSKE